MINKILQKLLTKLRSEFVINISWMFSFNTTGQVLSFLFTPILTRFFAQEAYGIFNFYINIINIISMVALFQYEQSYVVAKDEKDIEKLVHLSVVLLLVTLLTTILIVIPVGLFAFPKNIPTTYLFFIPLIVLIRGIEQMILALNVRYKKFKKISIISSQRSLTTKAVSLSVGFVSSFNTLAFLIGEICGRFFTLVLLYKHTIYNRFNGFIRSFSRRGLLKIMKEYKSIPLNLIPVSVFSVLSGQLLSYFIPFYYKLSDLGNYALAYGITLLPINLIVQATSPVFFQKMTDLRFKNQNNKSFNLLYGGSLGLLALGFIMTLPILFFAQEIFKIFLGETWEVAGNFAVPLVVLVVTELPFSICTAYLRSQRKEAILRNFIFIILIARLIITLLFAMNADILVLIFAYASVTAILRGVFIIYTFIKLTSIPFFRILVFSLAFLFVLVINFILVFTPMGGV